MSDEVKELPHLFEKDMQIGDEMIVDGSHVRIHKIKLVIQMKIIDDTKPDKSKITANIPMTDFNNPFPYKL